MSDERAGLGIDGNCGFALLGADLQEGEAEFVEIPKVDESTIPLTHHERYTGEVRSQRELAAKLLACGEALHKLKARLNKPELSYYLLPSHPYGR